MNSEARSRNKAGGIMHIKGFIKGITSAAMIAAVCLVIAAAGCGKKGPPVPAKSFGALNSASPVIGQTTAGEHRLPL